MVTEQHQKQRKREERCHSECCRPVKDFGIYAENNEKPLGGFGQDEMFPWKRSVWMEGSKGESEESNPEEKMMCIG